MFGGLTRLAQPMLLAMPPEQAHETTLRALEAGLYPRQSGPDDARLAQTVWGLPFPNPIGVGPGFDKEARVPDALLDMGCGFAEAGTITPLPQPGNPAPRVFRLIRDRAVINRLGFNSEGHAAAIERLKRRKPRGVVGINLGANKDSADRTGDYVKGIEAFAGLASYYMVNISSPNTPGLRDLQAPAALDELFGRVMQARERVTAAGTAWMPMIVKLAPDMAEADLEPILERLIAHKVDGIAVANTTVSRAGLTDPAAKEAGGLSGRPVFQRNTAMLGRVYKLTGGKVPLIGSGGIESGETALAKMEAGATLLQLYTGLIYEGASLIGRMKEHLARTCAAEGLPSISALVGRKADEWAAKPFAP